MYSLWASYASGVDMQEPSYASRHHNSYQQPLAHWGAIVLAVHVDKGLKGGLVQPIIIQVVTHLQLQPNIPSTVHLLHPDVCLFLKRPVCVTHGGVYSNTRILAA